MSTPNDLQIYGVWTPQATDPIYDGRNPTNVRASTTIFEDDFESGVFDPTYYDTSNNASIITEVSGNKAAQLQFIGAALGVDANADLRFDLQATYNKLSISYDLFIPANYIHRDDPPSNNKFFRLWQALYTEDEKIGASMRPEVGDGSTIFIEQRTVASGGMDQIGTSVSGFIAAADLDDWMHIDILVTSADTVQDGLIQIYKNDSLLKTIIPNNDFSGTLAGYRYGYLMGWANTGFTATTNILIDNLIFRDGIISI